MDSASQIVLGATLAHVTLGRQLGNRALLLGAALGTLPDLDVLVPYDDAIASFTFHRSWSHSLITLSALSIPIAWLCSRLFATAHPLSFKRWLFGVWLVLFTHPVLDAFTIYGTQIWWPLPVQPTAWGSMFIIDPVFTLPLFAAVILAWRRPWQQANRAVVLSLTLSTSYLAWTLYAQHSTHEKLKRTLLADNIIANHTLVAPFPFSLLWRSVVITDNEYREGYSSLLDKGDKIQLDIYENGKQACNDWLTHWPVARLDWFTRGAFALSVQDDQLIASDLRMGIEDDYVFEFAFAQWQNDNWQTIVTRQLPVNIDASRFMMLFKRMVDEDVDLTPIVPMRHRLLKASSTGTQSAEVHSEVRQSARARTDGPQSVECRPE